MRIRRITRARTGRARVVDVEIARGISNYAAGDARRILGRHSGEIAAVLGVCDYEEVVHRNNLALV